MTAICYSVFAEDVMKSNLFDARLVPQYTHLQCRFYLSLKTSMLTF